MGTPYSVNMTDLIEPDLEDFLACRQFATRSEVLSANSPVPASAGVYGWWFEEIPPGVPIESCMVRDGRTLLYVGISPKAFPRNGVKPSSESLRTRVRYHYGGNAEASTLRLSLGVLLAPVIGTQLRRVGSGKRRTFSKGEEALSAWMGEHAFVTWLDVPAPWELEERLIGHLDLPLNLAGYSSHPFHSELAVMRKAARQVADSLPVLPA